jgi:hypothetical protein
MSQSWKGKARNKIALSTHLRKNYILAIHLKTQNMKSLKAGTLLVTVLILLAFTSCKKDGSPSANLISPANRTTNVPLNQTFTCNVPPNASSFQFTFDDLTNPADGFNSGIILVPTYTPTALVSGHTYTWRVQIVTTDVTLNSDSWTFSTQ